MFTNDLVLRDFGDGRNYTLVRDLTWLNADGLTGYTVPQGFKTDLASIPSLLHSLIPKTGKFNRASVLHDYFYRTPELGLTRGEADGLFLVAMRADGVRYTRRYAMYWSLRAAGFVAWNSYR